MGGVGGMGWDLAFKDPKGGQETMPNIRTTVLTPEGYSRYLLKRTRSLELLIDGRLRK